MQKISRELLASLIEASFYRHIELKLLQIITPFDTLGIQCSPLMDSRIDSVFSDLSHKFVVQMLNSPFFKYYCPPFYCLADSNKHFSYNPTHKKHAGVYKIGSKP